MFKKRETLTQNIAYMALMAGINVIFVLLTALFPPLMFLMLFILPLASTVVTIFCKKKYYPIYFIVTVGLCLLTTFGIYIYDTFFYVIPSLITGFVFGVMIEKKVSAIKILAATNLLQFGLTLLTFYLLDIILPNMKFTDVIINMFGLQSFPYQLVFLYVFGYLISVIQNLFTYFIIKIEIKKLGISINLLSQYHFIDEIIVFIGAGLSIICYFYYAPLCYIFALFVSLFTIYQVLTISLSKKIIPIILLIASATISIFIFAFLYQYTVRPLSIVLINIPIGLINLVAIFNNSLLTRQNSLE